MIPRLFILVFIGFMQACMPDAAIESDNIELDQLREENDRLKEESLRKDSSINSFLAGFNRIQENLEIIKEKEGVLTINAGNPEIQAQQEDQIINDLQTINQLMAENREALARMNQKLRQGNNQAVELRRMFENLQQQVEVRNARINELQARLEQLNEAYRNLYTEYNARIDELDQKETELSTVWYAIGSSKELTEKDVITREGGFIGIGRADRLRADFNQDYFTEENSKTLREIPLLSKKATVVTTHPASSYRLENSNGLVEKLIILDPEAFWRASKYLVVVTDN